MEILVILGYCTLSTFPFPASVLDIQIRYGMLLLPDDHEQRSKGRVERYLSQKALRVRAASQ